MARDEDNNAGDAFLLARGQASTGRQNVDDSHDSASASSDDEAEIFHEHRVRKSSRSLTNIPLAISLPVFLLVCIVAMYISFTLGRHIEAAALSSVSTLAYGLLDGATAARDRIIFSNGTEWDRHPKLKIVAIVFFGRRQFVDLLDCYLRRSLAVNGGLIDEVQYIMHTDVAEDANWLRRLVKHSGLGQSYRIMEEDTTRPGWSQWDTYSFLYRDYMTDVNTIYLKIDDDVLFIDDHAVSELIRVTLEHPEAHSVLANIVNNKRSHWFHHRVNAVYPYLPDFNKSARWDPNSWRPSQLPFFPEQDLPPKGKVFLPGYRAPFAGHRWLPLPKAVNNLERTPYSNHLPDPTYILNGPGVGWTTAAQAHYFLFDNLEQGTLRKYDFGSTVDGSFNLRYMRWNINFLAIRGSHVARRPFWGDASGGHIDEELLTEIIPRELDMPALVATRAVVAHYSFKGDRPELSKTDLLARYRAYANERVCGVGNQKRPFGGGDEALGLGDGPADLGDAGKEGRGASADVSYG